MHITAEQFIKTAFGVSLGIIEQIDGTKVSAANALAAFLAAPCLVSEGLINRAETELSKRSDFKLLMDHAIEVNDERPNFIDYLDTLDLDTVQRINAAGQSFFTALVQDEQVIPMESIEKERLCALMRASLKTTLN
jgi:hypothetical protein